MEFDLSTASLTVSSLVSCETRQLEPLSFPQVAMMSRITLNLKKSVGRTHDVQLELPSMFTQGNLSKLVFTSQRGHANSKSGGEFAMISVAPSSSWKGNWVEESDFWDESGRVSSRVNELRTIGGTLRFADTQPKGMRGGK
jgi:hypothetical protein